MAEFESSTQTGADALTELLSGIKALSDTTAFGDSAEGRRDYAAMAGFVKKSLDVNLHDDPTAAAHQRDYLVALTKLLAAVADEVTPALDQFPSRGRTDLAVEAAWEIESISNQWIKASNELEVSDLALRGMSIRAKQLAHLVMGALGDDVADEADLLEKLPGRKVASISSEH